MDILIDLDGTMVDPAAGIVGSIQHALAALGRPVPAADDLHWAIGPSLRSTFAELSLSAREADDALRLYRDNYRAGAMYDVVVYAGIPQALSTLRASGHRLIVATAKPHVFARPILEKFALVSHFHAIHGAELDGVRDDKADLIAHIIETEGVDPGQALMIGDRRFDSIGAARNAIACIGAAWGYGSREELTQAGVVALCERPADLPALVADLRSRHGFLTAGTA